ncbi:hypothetical protein C8R48DRAFT_218704 [Suillus tomentosus]|nr:hypothetical protein C8R48DRAFT_218704 [Suillus tomentosus]
MQTRRGTIFFYWVGSLHLCAVCAVSRDALLQWCQMTGYFFSLTPMANALGGRSWQSRIPSEEKLCATGGAGEGHYARALVGLNYGTHSALAKIYFPSGS